MVVICSVPILDGSGTVVERLICAVRVKEWRPFAVAAFEERVTALVSRRLSARMRHLARMAAGRSDKAQHVERAIAGYLQAAQYPHLSQPELFSQRSERALREATSAVVEITAEQDEALRATASATTFTFGQAAVELVMERAH